MRSIHSTLVLKAALKETQLLGWLPFRGIGQDLTGLHVEFKQTTTTHITASTSSNSCRATVLQHKRWEKLVHSSIHLKEMADHESEQEQPQHYQSSAWVSTYSCSAEEHNSKEEEHFALPSSYRPSSFHTPVLPRQKVPEVLQSKAKPALLEGNVWKTNFWQIQHCAYLRFVLVEFWTLLLLLISKFTDLTKPFSIIHTENKQSVTDKKRNTILGSLKVSELIVSHIALIPTRETHRFHLWTHALHPRTAHLVQMLQVHLLLARQNCPAEKLPGRLSAFACCPGNLTQKCFKTTMRNFFLVLNKTKRKRG